MTNSTIKMSYGPSRDSKEQCHKMIVKIQKTFSFKCSNSCRKSLSPSHVNAILSAINAADATLEPQYCLLFLLVGMCWWTLLAVGNNILAAISSLFSGNIMFAMLSLSPLIPSLVMILFNIFANLPHSLNSFSHWVVSFPSWFCANVEFALLLLSCSLPSLVSEPTLAVVLLFDLLANLPCSLNSFSHQVVSSPSWFHGNAVEFAALSLAPLLTSLVGELTLALAILFDLFADLLSSLNSFSCLTVTSNSRSSDNVVFAVLSVTPLLPSLVGKSTVALTILFDLFADLCCSLFSHVWATVLTALLIPFSPRDTMHIPTTILYDSSVTISLSLFISSCNIALSCCTSSEWHFCCSLSLNYLSLWYVTFLFQSWGCLLPPHYNSMQHICCSLASLLHQ